LEDAIFTICFPPSLEASKDAVFLYLEAIFYLAASLIVSKAFLLLFVTAFLFFN
jgi:hypothetical protein